MDEEEKGNKINYCKVCRVHYENGRKHNFSRNHRKAFDLIVNKFRKKVLDCHQYLRQPEAMDGELEPGATFWCHFCEELIQKHVTDRVISIKYGGLFEHLGSHQHHKYTHAFWKQNGGDKKLKKDFVLSTDEYIRYKLRCKEALVDLSNKIDENRTQAAEMIKFNEMERSKVFSEQHQLNQTALTGTQTLTNSHGVMQNSTGRHEGLRVWKGGIVKRRLRSTTQHASWKFHNNSRKHDFTTDDVALERSASNLPTLAFVRIDEASRHSYSGNIHTGAQPPWLRNDDDNNTESNSDREQPIIGPSLEDFKQHLAKTRKKRLNAKGVGANFDHSAETSENWLPSFGRVWNSGPRWQSRQEYRTETKTPTGMNSKFKNISQEST